MIDMKTIKVVAAVICDSFRKKSQVFATARGYGDYKGQWEFPGGKIEANETPHQALIREIKEELETEIIVGDLIGTIEYDYQTFHLSMECFWCEVSKGELILKEAQEGKWLTKDDIYSVQWLPADLKIIADIKNMME
jgi:8-oxo-dGTP diphosphatase